MQVASEITSQKRSWINREDRLEGRDDKRIRVDDLNGPQSCFRSNDDSGSEQPQRHGVNTSSRAQQRVDACDDDKSGSSDTRMGKSYLFLDDLHTYPYSGAGIQSGLGDESMYQKGGLPEHEEQLPVGSPNLDLVLGVEKKQSRSGGEKDIAAAATSSKVEKDENEEDATASLSLSLAYPLSDKVRTASTFGRPPASVEMEQTPAGRHE